MYIIVWIVLAALVGLAGTNRKGGFWKAFIIGLLLSPLVALILIIGSGKKNPIGCKNCGNKHNEAEYCGLCKKNSQGLTREETSAQTA